MPSITLKMTVKTIKNKLSYKKTSESGANKAGSFTKLSLKKFFRKSSSTAMPASKTSHLLSAVRPRTARGSGQPVSLLSKPRPDDHLYRDRYADSLWAAWGPQSQNYRRRMTADKDFAIMEARVKLRITELEALEAKVRMEKLQTDSDAKEHVYRNLIMHLLCSGTQTANVNAPTVDTPLCPSSIKNTHYASPNVTQLKYKLDVVASEVEHLTGQVGTYQSRTVAERKNRELQRSIFEAELLEKDVEIRNLLMSLQKARSGTEDVRKEMNAAKIEVERLRLEIAKADSELSDAYEAAAEAWDEVTKARKETVKAQEEAFEARREADEWCTERNEARVEADRARVLAGKAETLRAAANVQLIEVTNRPEKYDQKLLIQATQAQCAEEVEDLASSLHQIMAERRTSNEEVRKLISAGVGGIDVNEHDALWKKQYIMVDQDEWLALRSINKWRGKVCDDEDDQFTALPNRRSRRPRHSAPAAYRNPSESSDASRESTPFSDISLIGLSIKNLSMSDSAVTTPSPSPTPEKPSLQ